MKREKIIRQLESLRDHCESMRDKENGESIWDDDIKALTEAIRTAKKGKYTRPCKGVYFKGKEQVSFDDAEFHGWGNDYQEFETGPGNYTIAIIELADGRIITTTPELVEFTDRR